MMTCLRVGVYHQATITHIENLIPCVIHLAVDPVVLVISVLYADKSCSFPIPEISSLNDMVAWVVDMEGKRVDRNMEW